MKELVRTINLYYFLIFTVYKGNEGTERERGKGKVETEE